MSQTLPPSLAAYFIPPADSVGTFALLTGYSADYHFLNDTLEKFTQNIKSQRAFEGAASIAMMLDENHPQITAVDCPGLVHLASTQSVKNKFKLLHAKVGLLLFKHKNTEQQTIRLVVSTGNWTRQTLEDSLDLVWSIDYKVGQTQDEQVQVDIAKAYDFLKYTLGFFDEGLLTSKKVNNEPTITALRYQQFKDALGTVKRVKNVKPRFFDNRSQSLLSQIPELIRSHSTSSKRNYLCVGSGFYEGGDLVGQMPKAIAAIEKFLRESDLLTQQPGKDIFVNPLNCQAVATNTETIQKNGWCIRPAFDALYEGKNHVRSLHAKFIFSATESGNKCQSSWLYLGSGNITAPGLLNKATLHGGNLEAGILFSPKGLNWYGDPDPDLCISQKLPINWDNEKIIADTEQLSAGGDMPEHDEQYHAAPVSYFTISQSGSSECWLSSDEEGEHAYQVVSPENEVCEILNEKVFWAFSKPRQVLVRWQSNGSACSTYVPVFDEFGRLAATALPELEVDDAWSQLGAFPVLPCEWGDNDGDNKDGKTGLGGQTNNGSSSNSDYYLNQMMCLIEQIAQKQTHIKELDWPQWCHRLEQTFCQMANASSIQYFHQVSINPLSALKAKPFRPSFAEDTQSKAGLLYEQVLSKIEVTLGLTHLLQLGDEHE